jgi:hypothetical protein
MQDTLEYINILLKYKDELLSCSDYVDDQLALEDKINKELTKHFVNDNFGLHDFNGSAHYNESTEEIVLFEISCGLCDNLPDGYDVVANYVKDWEYFTGSGGYVVPDPDVLYTFHDATPVSKFTARCAAERIYGRIPMYSGEYGKLRFDLLEYLRGKILGERSVSK